MGPLASPFPHLIISVSSQVYMAAAALSAPVVIESIRTPEEVVALRNISNQQMRLLSVDADVYTRYTRIKARKSETDDVGFDQFQVGADAVWMPDNIMTYGVCMSLANQILGEEMFWKSVLRLHSRETVLKITHTKMPASRSFPEQSPEALFGKLLLP